MKKVFIILAFLVILSVGFVSSGQAEQKFNKIYLSPLYVESLAGNEIMTYNLTVDTPDGISSVENAMITFKVWHNPSIRYYLLVNNQTCNTPSFYVSTTYANAGEGTIFFDCSNIITKEGKYTVTFQPDDDIGTVTGWVDLTYTNDPLPEATVQGTEYKAGDEGKVFLQLLNDQSQPISNASCFASIYYPNSEIWKYQQSMNYVGEGLYTYDFDVPYQLGNYPVSAFCTTPEQIFTTEYAVYDGFESDDMYGGSGWDNYWYFDSDCAITSSYHAIGSYSLECRNDNDPWRRIAGNSSYARVDYDFWVRAVNLEIGDYAYVILEDGNGVEYNLYTFSSDNDNGVWYEITGSLTTSSDGFNFINDMMFELDTNGNLNSADYYYVDEINLEFRSAVGVNTSEYQVVRGTGEVHVNPSNGGEYLSNFKYGELTNESFDEDFTFHYDVISQTSFNKTGKQIELELWRPFPCDHVLNVSKRLSNGTVVDLEYSGSTNELGRCEIIVEIDLNVGETSDIEVRTENYWKRQLYYDYSETLLQAEMINLSCQNYISENNLTNISIPLESIPYGQDAMWLSCASYLDKYNHYEEVADDFFYIVNGNFNFTSIEMIESESNWLHMEKILDSLNIYANTIFNGLNLGNSYSLALLQNASGNVPLYAFHFSGISTGYLNYLATLGIDTANETEIANYIWNHSNRTLTDFGFTVDVNTTEIANAVWNYNGTINSNILSQFTSAIWSYINRTLTSFGFTVDVNTTEIANAVWSATTRTLTAFTFDIIDEEMISNYVWNNTNRNLTYYQNFGDQTNYTLIQNLIETYGNDDNTNYSQIQDIVSNYGNDLTAELIWNYTSRTLTDFGFTVDTTNNNLTAEDIWNYTSRNLTFFPVQLDLTNYTQIQNLISNFGNEDVANYTQIQNIVTQYGNNNIDLTNYTEIQDLITQYGNDLTAQIIWEYSNRNLTYYENFGDQTNYTLIQNLIETYGNDQSDLTNYSTIESLILASENNISVEDIWNYANRNLSYYEDVVNYTLIDSLVLAIQNNLTAQDIWEYAGDKNLTYYEDFGDQTNYSLIEGLVLASENNISVADIWGYANRNLTYYQDFGDQTNYTLIRDIVMDYANEDSTNYTLVEQIVTQYGNNNTDLTNYTLLQDLIVTYGNINTDLTNYSEITNLIIQYANDDNTNYSEIEDLLILYDNAEVNYSQIQQIVTDYGNNNTDLTNYSAIEELIILYGNNNTDLTNYTQIQDLVEQYANEDNTNYTLMSELITAYGNDLTAQLIWEYSGNRNLTYYENFGDQTNYSQIQSIIQNCSSCNMTEESIWSYFNRTLTEFQFFNVTDIAQAIWNYTNRSINEFEFYIDASPQSVAQSIDFEVYSLLEISNYPVVEGQFTCYMEGYKSETEIIFNKAISKTTPYREIKTLNFPVGVHGLERIICNLDVLGTNDLQDIATDTFIASYSGEEPTNETEPIINETEENVTLINNIQNQTINSVKSAKVEIQNNLWVYLTILGGLFLILICFFLWRQKYGKN